MSRTHIVRKVLHGLTVPQLAEIFTDSSWGAIATAGQMSPALAAHFANPANVDALKTTEIEIADDWVFATVRHWGNHGNPCDIVSLLSKGSEKKLGIPSAIQQVLKNDLVDFARLTGRSRATTNIYIGNRLETDWHSHNGRCRTTPLMVRDLSGHGWYYAEPVNGQDTEVGAVPEGDRADWMVDKNSLAANFNSGVLVKKQIQAGERVFFQRGAVTREFHTWGDSGPLVQNVRTLTAAYNF